MNKKTIGIVGYRNTNENSFGIGITYADYFSKFGSLRIIMPDEDLVSVDLLVLPGGADVTPSSYGATPGFRTSNPDLFKQHFYDNQLKLYVESKTPILGICLGHQMLNTYFGGSLIQNLWEHPSSTNRYEKGHKVIGCDKDGRPNGKKFEVNSHHHQAVALSTLSEELNPLLLAEFMDENEAIVEAFQHKSLPICGIQWHPEEWMDIFTARMIASLLDVKIVN